jgi:aryl-alcohol dehydrogenase-like predicted oxidoreductase
MDPGPIAIGTWSGGRFMSFGEPLEDGRLLALLRPGEGIDTVITADAYGAGEADRALGEALAGIDRQDYCLVGAIGHDFYEGAREGAKGYPRFTDPRLRPESAYAGYIRMATERSLERCGADHFDLLLLHNPDRRGYRSTAVWDGLERVREAGLTRMLGVAPGPANGFTLDLIACLERFSAHIDWAMIILNPLEPWPGELVLAAARAREVKLITRVVDYGGLFHDDVLPGHDFGARDHRAFRPAGWVEDGRAKLERMRPIAERHQLTMLQLACAWNLAHEPVRCAAPTLIQERGACSRAVEDKRAELAAFARRLTARSPSRTDATGPAGPGAGLLAAEEVREIRAIGDNKGCMALKGASPEHAGDEAPDRWPLDPSLAAVAARWEIEPERDLARAQLSGAH